MVDQGKREEVFFRRHKNVHNLNMVISWTVTIIFICKNNTILLNCTICRNILLYVSYCYKILQRSYFFKNLSYVKKIFQESLFWFAFWF